MWWLMSVIPTLLEAEVGASLEPRISGPARANWINLLLSKTYYIIFIFNFTEFAWKLYDGTIFGNP